MSWQVLDVSQNGRYLNFDRNSIVINDAGGELGRLHLPDINAVIIHGHQCTVSIALMAKLAEFGVSLTICGTNHMPISQTIPVTGHHLQTSRASLQADCKLTLKKRIWQNIVHRKILEQAATLTLQNKKEGASLSLMAKAVRAGDPVNQEARAARYYWQRLFGTDFRRDRNLPGLNGHLNYGYIIIRSAICRAIVSAGLIPALGIHHRNAQNSFCLADDFMEVFRPYVDTLVYFNRQKWTGTISDVGKAQLAGLITQTVTVNKETTDLFRAMTLYVQSFVEILEGKSSKLVFPDKFASLYLQHQVLPL